MSVKGNIGKKEKGEGLEEREYLKGKTRDICHSCMSREAKEITGKRAKK